MRENGVAAPRYQPLVMVGCALAVGITVDRFFGWGFPVWLTCLGLSLPCWLSFWFAKRDRSASIILAVAIACLGGLWHGRMWRYFVADELGIWLTPESHGVAVELIALTTPRLVPAPALDPLNGVPRGDRTRCEVELREVRRDGRWVSASGRAILTVEGHLLGVRAGDRLRVLALASRLEPPRNPGEFDFAAYARAERRLIRLHVESPDAVQKLGTGSRWIGWNWIDWLRERGDRQLRRHVRADQSGLASAILLGTRERLDEGVLDGFFVTGLSHLIAISGLNVAIFAYGFWLVARCGLFSRRVALTAAIVLAILYAMLTDAQSPVVRAAVLVVCVCWARFRGRRSLGFNTLAAAGIVVLTLQPAALFQVGAQLSFLAVAVLCWANPGSPVTDQEVDPLDRLIARSRPWPVRWARRTCGWMWSWFQTSAFVWLIALPLVWYHFHIVSPIALVLNPLVMFPMALALYAGFGALLGPLISETLADICGWVCASSLSTIEGMLKLARGVPGNHVWLSAPSGVWIAGFYLGLAGWMLFPGMRPPLRWRWTMLAVVVTSGVWSARLTPPPITQREVRPLTCTFVSVGHGTAVIIELPNGETMLYDAGHLGTPQSSMQSVSACLWSKGISHLDAIVISHADLDHYNAVPALLERFSVGVVYVSPQMFRTPDAPLEVLRRSILSRRIPLRHLTAGDSLRAADGSPAAPVRMPILHPPPAGVAGSDNANSIVLLLEYAGVRILLPGDLEPPGLEMLFTLPRLDCDVVMAPHHGSRFSDPRAFADWSAPEWVIISCSRRGETAQVRESYGHRGSQILTTQSSGAVEVRVSPGRTTVKGLR